MRRKAGGGEAAYQSCLQFAEYYFGEWRGTQMVAVEMDARGAAGQAKHFFNMPICNMCIQQVHTICRRKSDAPQVLVQLPLSCAVRKCRCTGWTDMASSLACQWNMAAQKYLNAFIVLRNEHILAVSVQHLSAKLHMHGMLQLMCW